MIYIRHTHSKEAYLIIADLAKRIWTEHYTPIIGEQQITYMLEKFQSVLSIEKQVIQKVKYYLLLHGEEPVGYFSYYKKEDLLFLSKLYVLSSARGKGIGKMALSFIEQQTKEFGLKKFN